MDTTAQPYYRKMASTLAEGIRNGQYGIGDSLPTERELSETFGVSRHTTREALRQLETRGLITRRQGSGSTVVATSPPVRYEQNIQTIEDMLQHGNATRLHVLASKALAALRSRDFVTPDDVRDIAPAVLRHRLLLRSDAEIEGLTADAVLEEILSAVEVPR